MFSFLHAADIHLDSPLRGLEHFADDFAGQVRGAVRRAFDNLIDLALREQVAFMLLAGDIYDGDWKDFNTGLYFNQRMNMLKDAGIQVFMVSGNHDAASQISKSLRLPDNVHHFSARKADSHIMENPGVAIHGQSFAGRFVADDLSVNYPQALPHLFNIGLLHTALTGREGHEPYAPCSSDGLCARGYDYWALGHVHKREIVNREPWIVFPGNIQGRHIRETGAKGATLVRVADGRVDQVEEVALDVLRWELCRIEVTGCDTLSAIYERIRQQLAAVLAAADGRPVAVRLELHGHTRAQHQLQTQSVGVTEEIRSLALDLGGAGLGLEKVRFNTAATGRLDRLLHRDDALGGLLRNLQDLDLDAGQLRELEPEIDAFFNKLPPELRAGDDPFDPADADQWQQLCDDIRQLLTAQLLTAGDEP